MILLILWLIVSGAVGGAIGQTRNCPAVGVLLGVLFGPIGWLLAWLNDRREQCPQCVSRLPDGAMRCRYCGAAFTIPVGYEIKK